MCILISLCDGVFSPFMDKKKQPATFLERRTLVHFIQEKSGNYHDSEDVGTVDTTTIDTIEMSSEIL